MSGCSAADKHEKPITKHEQSKAVVGKKGRTARAATWKRSFSSHLLGSPQVRRELKISHETSIQILNLLNEAARLSQGGVMTYEAAEKLEAERKQTDPTVLRCRALDLLTAAQLDRLEQLNLQQAAPFVLNNPSVVKKIGASTQQVRRVQAAQKREFDRHQRMLQPLVSEHFAQFGKNPPRESRARAIERDRRIKQLGSEYLHRCRAALLRVLTPAQEARWKALLGAPFNMRQLTYDGVRSYPQD
jgi:hypothetical protein